MKVRDNFRYPILRCASLGVVFLLQSTVGFAQDAPIIQPGAPGESPKIITAEEASKIAANSYSKDDVQFMQDMIPHHNQAVQMAELVADRTNRPELVDVAGVRLARRAGYALARVVVTTIVASCPATARQGKWG